MTTRLLLLVLLASLLVVGCVASGLGARKLKSVQAIGDLQHKIYKSPFQPLKLAKRRATIVPFFSPDHSIETETNLVQRAKRSIDISIPSVGSWHYCHPRDECGGCPVATIREKETFPIFTAVVNALHQGVKVRLITNKYEDERLCTSEMDLITYLHFAGAQVKYYASTTFTHSKYISIDGTEAAISSVNFSKTSILKNREAGIIIANDTSGELVKFTESIFEYDFENGQDFHPQQRYAQADLDIIKDKTPLNVNVSQHFHFHYCNTESPRPVRHHSEVNIGLIASPDYAFESVMSVLNQTKKSLLLSIYEITHPSFADVLIALKSKGVELKLFVSNDIFAEKDKEAASKVYTQLYNHGIHVVQSHKSCLTYSHQKFWIIDDNILFMSTGNWAPSDYPLPPYVFPPAGHADWRRSNRDITIQIEGHNSVLNVFKQVFDLDYSQGHQYYP